MTPVGLRRNPEIRFRGDPAAVVITQIDFLLPSELNAETRRIVCIRGVAENRPVLDARKNLNAVVPFRGTEKARTVGVIVRERSDSRIVRFNGNPVVSGFEIRQNIDLIKRPVMLISAHGTAADIASVDMQTVALIRRNFQRRRRRHFFHVEIVTESRITVLHVERVSGPDPEGFRIHFSAFAKIRGCLRARIFNIPDCAFLFKTGKRKSIPSELKINFGGGFPRGNRNEAQSPQTSRMRSAFITETGTSSCRFLPSARQSR